LRAVHYISILIVILSGLSCKKENRWDLVKRTGDIVTETRTVAPFKKIYLEDNVNVFITQDSVFEVKVEAGENLISLIKTEVRDSQIFISNDNKYNWTRSYKPKVNVYLRMPEIKFITSDGTGKIQSLNTITTPSFDYRLKDIGDIELTVNNHDVLGHMHGPGDVYLHGATYHHACHIVGNGFIHAEDLTTSYTWMYTNTSGNIYMRVQGLLQLTLDGSGDIIYTGHPGTVETITRGTGKIIAQ
jgi:hypothetical protein